MKKKRYHVIKYNNSGHYLVVHASDLNNYVKEQAGFHPTKIKLIKVFDDRNEAIQFRHAINLF